MNLQEVTWGDGLDCSGSEQIDVVDTCKCGNELSDSTKCGEFTD